MNMISTYQRLQRQRDAGEINGFTLIFALGGITGKSAVAACQADGATISTAMAAFNAQNPGITVDQPKLLNTTFATYGGPYVQSWPSNLPHYAFAITAAALTVSVAPAGIVTGTGSFIAYTGPSVCSVVQ
jgi:hypothetical protein